MDFSVSIWEVMVFNFDASFFEGYAAANNLSIVHSCYLIYPSEYEQIVVPCNKNLFNTFDLTKVKGVDISYVFRKRQIKNLIFIISLD